MRNVVPSPLRTTKAQVATALVAGALGYVVLALLLPTAVAAMGAVTLAEIMFLTLSLATLWPMDVRETGASATREDLTPRADEVLVALASVLAMVCIVTLHLGISRGADGEVVTGGWQSVQALLTLAGVFGAWACVHQTYAVHYAHLYYSDDNGPVGGIEFGPEGKPAFFDFLYFSYAIGMTYGVTDLTVTSRKIRKVVLRHSMLSFIFGMVILGAAINLVTGFFGI